MNSSMMRMLLLAALVLVFVLPSRALHVTLSQGDELLVQTLNGPVLGEAVSGYKRWLGIPFAAPPLGPLRFRTPQQVIPWSQTLVVTENPPACMQADGERIVYGRRSEDCLYLNIFAPLSAHVNSSLPVMFWIYGGSFLAGGIAFEEYNGGRDAITNDMIFVTANYRLGPFGFLAAEQLRDSRGSVGNYGIEDQRAAMRWVHENIAFFGGDASKMMIFGESAGAASVGVHLASPLSASLFSSAGMESGSGLAHWSATSMDDATAVFQHTVMLTNCSDAPDVVHCLRQIEASALAEITMACGVCSGPVRDSKALHFSPTIDGVNLPAAPWILAKQGKIAAVPVLVGTNHDEATFFLSADKSIRDLTLANLTTVLISQYGANVTEVLLKLYPVPSPEFPLPYWALIAMYTDSSMACPARQAARAAFAIGQKAFLYQFSHIPLITSSDKWLRAYHSCELAYVFQWDLELLSPGERKLAANMAALWGNMARSGSPGSHWPAYDMTEELSLHFDASFDEVQLTVQQHLKASVCDFWDDSPYIPQFLCKILETHSSDFLCPGPQP
jgi:para-nitrobenzyl esterase